ncbi:ATP-binding protein [soil metagenome]
MALKLIEAHNFKSFRDLRLELSDLNVLIGANGAGKSNVLSLLRFIRDIASDGLVNAVALQGGFDYITNLSIGRTKPVELKLTLIPDPKVLSRRNSNLRNKKFTARSIQTVYSISLLADGNRDSFAIPVDRVEIEFEIYQLDDEKQQPRSTGNITFSKENGTIKRHVLLPEGIEPGEIFLVYSMAGAENQAFAEYERPGTIMEDDARSPLSRWDPFDLASNLKSMAIFDINVHPIKQLVQVQAKADLEEDGSNLAIVLRRILANPEQQRMLTNLLHDVLPFIVDIETEQFADRFLVLKLRESYNKQALPASLLSDGTVYVVALIVALYFSRRSLIAIEEPEKHIHPYLLARVAELLKDAAQRTPVIVTTQNPELVRNVDIQSLLLVTRDKEGFSTIRRPAESDDVRAFLQNEIGVADLFTQNLLGV